MSMHSDFLIEQWRLAKEAEQHAVEMRRQIEDELVEIFGVDIACDRSVKLGHIRITTRLTRKVDADLVQEIAAEHHLTEFLHTLFRWKPEVDLKAWKYVDPDVQLKLSPAITVTAGRPSFSFTGE